MVAGQGGKQTFPTGGVDGKEKWVNGASSNQTFVHYGDTGNSAQQAISFELNQLLCQPPVRAF